jgi:hypothetical protein
MHTHAEIIQSHHLPSRSFDLENIIALSFLFLQVSLLLAPSRNLALLANIKRDSAVRAVPLRSPRWDFRQAYAFEMEPLFLALFKVSTLPGNSQEESNSRSRSRTQSWSQS